MQALSRNTASVAQDFRSAGGEQAKLTANASDLLKGIITLTNINRDATTEANGAIGNPQHQQTTKKSSWNVNAMSPIDHSPPAVTLRAITNNGATNGADGLKRRRKMSPDKDKENVNELLMKQLAFLKQQQLMFLKNLNESVMPDTERLKAVKDINEIFEKMYDHSMSVISSLENDKKTNEKFNIPEFLMKSNEITVIVEPKKSQQNNIMSSSSVEEQEQEQREQERIQHEQNESRKNRKQLKPKKIIEQSMDEDEEEVNLTTNKIQRRLRRQAKTISEVRDKHMVLLLARKRYCFICRNKSSDVNTCHSRTSLLLHNLWRHSTKQYECHHCQEKFNRIYKLKLHKKLKMH
jgi:hypothetical protein